MEFTTPGKISAKPDNRRDLFFRHRYFGNHINENTASPLDRSAASNLLFGPPNHRASNSTSTVNGNSNWRPPVRRWRLRDSKWETSDCPFFQPPYFSPTIFTWVTAGIGNISRFRPNGRPAAVPRIRRAFQDAEIFVNGGASAKHKAVTRDFPGLTDAVKAGDNSVACASTTIGSRTRPARGRARFSGGIYRDVRLVVTGPLHVTWQGTFVTTPQLSAESGTVNVKTEIRNDGQTSGSAGSRRTFLIRTENVASILPRNRFPRNDGDVRSNDRPHCQTEAVASRPSVLYTR